MDVHLYKYNCSRWYGIESGLRNIYTQNNVEEEEIIKNAELEAQKISGSKTCNISLILKYKLTIDSTETYSNITKIPFNENTSGLMEKSKEF